MRLITIFIASILVAACAGNPPAWWNPSGTYGTADNVSTAQTAPQIRRTQPIDEPPAEQDIEPAFDKYEEISLSPLEEDENLSADSDDSDATAQIADEDNTSLPLPSVLE